MSQLASRAIRTRTVSHEREASRTHLHPAGGVFSVKGNCTCLLQSRTPRQTAEMTDVAIPTVGDSEVGQPCESEGTRASAAQ